MISLIRSSLYLYTPSSPRVYSQSVGEHKGRQLFLAKFACASCCRPRTSMVRLRGNAGPVGSGSWSTSQWSTRQHGPSLDVPLLTTKANGVET